MRVRFPPRVQTKKAAVIIQRLFNFLRIYYSSELHSQSSFSRAVTASSASLFLHFMVRDIVPYSTEVHSQPIASNFIDSASTSTVFPHSSLLSVEATVDDHVQLPVCVQASSSAFSSVYEISGCEVGMPRHVHCPSKISVVQVVHFSQA